MKLTNSKTETEFRTALTRSNAELFSDTSKKRLLHTLKSNFPDMTSAYILSWTPEQGEDIYLLLIDNHTITKVELDNQDNSAEPTVVKISLTEYRKGLSQRSQIQLAVALDLASR